MFFSFPFFEKHAIWQTGGKRQHFFQKTFTTKLNWIRSIWKLTYSIWLNSIATSKNTFSHGKLFHIISHTHTRWMKQTHSFYFHRIVMRLFRKLKVTEPSPWKWCVFLSKQQLLFSTFPRSKNFDLRNLQPFVPCFTIYWLYCFLILTWKSRCKKKNTHFPFHQKSTFEEITTTLFTTRFHNIHFFGFIFLHLLVQHSSLNLSLLLVFLNKPFLIRKTVLSEFVACILKNFHPVVFIWNDRTVPKHNRRCLSSNACSVRAKETIPLALYTLFSSKYSLTTIGNEKMVLKGFMEKDFFLHFSIPKSLRCFLLTNDFFFFLMGWPLTTSSILHGTSWTVSTSFSSTFPFHTLIY